MKFTNKDYTTKWQALEIDIMMGFGISPLLFVLVMELIYYEVQQIHRKEWWQMNIWLFLLTGLSWMTSHFSFRPKSLSMSYYKGTMTFSHGREWRLSQRKVKARGSVREIHFKIGGYTIATVREKPVKSLGRLYSIPMTDRYQGPEVQWVALKGF